MGNIVRLHTLIMYQYLTLTNVLCRFVAVVLLQFMWFLVFLQLFGHHFIKNITSIIYMAYSLNTLFCVLVVDYFDKNAYLCYRGCSLCWAWSGKWDYDGRSRLHSSCTEECPVAHGDAEADSYGNPGRETPQLHTAKRQQPTHTPHAPCERGTANAQRWVQSGTYCSCGMKNSNTYKRRKSTMIMHFVLYCGQVRWKQKAKMCLTLNDTHQRPKEKREIF